MSDKRMKLLTVLLSLCILLCACANRGGKTGFGFAPRNANSLPFTSENQQIPSPNETSKNITSQRIQISSDISSPENQEEKKNTYKKMPAQAQDSKNDSISVPTEDLLPAVVDKQPVHSQTQPNFSNQSEQTNLTQQSDADILEIGEKMFLTQINDMYFNFDSYKDKTIVVEGMYTTFYSWDGSQTSPVVYRKGPGCCGNDGWGGFLLRYDGQLPEDNDWIRVVGTPELVTEKYYTNLYLNVTALEVRSERGAEFVLQ